MLKFLIPLIALALPTLANAQYQISPAKPIASEAVADSFIVATRSIQVVRLAATTGASGGYLMVFDRTTKPANGAVTPAICRAVGANSSVSLVFTNPARFDNGLVMVFSTTGCYTLTLSPTAFFEASPK